MAEFVPHGQRPPELLIHGWNAVQAVFHRRREAIRKIWHSADRARDLAPMLRWAAQQRVGYGELSDDKLTEQVESLHHEGVALAVRQDAPPPTALALERTARREIALMIVGVENPHNVGALARSAAFLGVELLIACGTARHPFTGAMYRVAEGGAEYVTLAFEPQPSEAATALRQAGYCLLGADQKARATLDDVAWTRPVALVLGGERQGLPEDVKQRCFRLVRVPGARREFPDSLNVSVAGGILLSALTKGVR